MNNLDKYFEDLLQRYYRFLHHQLQKFTEPARDKEYAQTLQFALLNFMQDFQQTDPFIKELTTFLNISINLDCHCKMFLIKLLNYKKVIL